MRPFVCAPVLLAFAALACGAPSENPVRFLVKTTSGRPMVVRERPSDTIGEFKSKLQAIEGVPFTLVHAGERLEEDHRTLAEHNFAILSQDDEAIKQVGTEQTNVGTGNKFFGVDRDDKEAVEQRIRELSDEKFKELFGDEVNVDDIHFHHSHDGPQNGEKEPSFFTEFKSKFQEYAKQNTVKSAVKWLFDLFKKPQGGEQK